MPLTICIFSKTKQDFVVILRHSSTMGSAFFLQENGAMRIF
jgi:hypothetical protein